MTTSTDATTQPFYNKFETIRKSTGETLDWRETFTLIPAHDEHAVIAMRAYADSIEKDNPTLATQLRENFRLN